MNGEKNNCKTDFISWCAGNKLEIDPNKLEMLFSEAFGSDSEGIYETDNSSEIKNKIISLILDRRKTGINTTSDYVCLVSGSLYYVEYLECGQPTLCDCEKITEENQLRYSLIVAYYLSRANDKGLKLLGYKNFTEAFSDFAVILKQKPSTIKNMRDEFDPYFDNGRKGWYQRSLSKSRQEIFDEFAKVSEDKLFAIVNGIKNSYYDAETENQDERRECKKIKITSQNMKEIKTKK